MGALLSQFPYRSINVTVPLMFRGHGARHTGVFLLASSQYGTLLNDDPCVGYFANLCKIKYIIHIQAAMPLWLLARAAQFLRQIGSSGYAPQISGIKCDPAVQVSNAFKTEKDRPAQKKKTAPERNPEAGVCSQINKPNHLSQTLPSLSTIKAPVR
ncbi:hypothetical protein [Rhizobium mongolense]